MPSFPTEICIQEGLEECIAARRARALAPTAAVRVFQDLTDLMREMAALEASEAKRRLVITRRAGGFVKDFPAGQGVRPSGWRYFIPAIGCPADCAYCFLRTYHAGGAPVVFDGLDDMFAEIETIAAAEPGAYFYGGELCDNLMLEEYVGVVPRLISMFGWLPGATLELRTKSDEIAPLIRAAAAGGGRAPGNVIISWTFTPESTARRFEAGAAPVGARVEAARRAAAAGYRIGVRLDPVILKGAWEQDYEDLVRMLGAALAPEAVESIHLGCFRFTPALKAAVGADANGLFANEFVEGPDGKMRYPRPLRSAAYARIARMAAAWGSRIPVKLCMETDEVCADFRDLRW